VLDRDQLIVLLEGLGPTATPRAAVPDHVLLGAGGRGWGYYATGVAAGWVCVCVCVCLCVCVCARVCVYVCVCSGSLLLPGMPIA
jgi:hypothetical protein